MGKPVLHLSALRLHGSDPAPQLQSCFWPNVSPELLCSGGKKPNTTVNCQGRFGPAAATMSFYPGGRVRRFKQHMLFVRRRDGSLRRLREARQAGRSSTYTSLRALSSARFFSMRPQTNASGAPFALLDARRRSYVLHPCIGAMLYRSTRIIVYICSMQPCANI